MFKKNTSKKFVKALLKHLFIAKQTQSSIPNQEKNVKKEQSLLSITNDKKVQNPAL